MSRAKHVLRPRSEGSGDEGETAAAQAVAGPQSTEAKQPARKRGGRVERRPAKKPAPRVSAPSADDLSTLSDEALAEGVRASSEPHFNVLYARYYDRIYAFVYKRVRNHADAEEFVQETFVAALQSLDGYRGQSSLLAWVYGIARNTVNNQLRRSISRREKMDTLDRDRLVPALPVAMGSPEEQLQLARFTDAIRDGLGMLAPWHAEVFAMRHVEDLSIQEIVDRTDRTSDAVRSSLYRVKRMLIEAAQGDGAEGVEGEAAR